VLCANSLPTRAAGRRSAAGVNISKVAQEALSSTLARNETDRWLDRLDGLARVRVSHKKVIEAIDEARSELGDDAPA
jgi:post-segregation antitoxin (ccd killing protein)